MPAAWVKLDSLGGFATAVSQDGPTNSAFFLQYSGADNRFGGLDALLERLESATLEERDVAELESLAEQLEAAAARLERVG